jgi:hypothetical protein
MSLVLPGTLEAVRNRVNQFLLNAAPRSDGWVLMGNAISADGSVEASGINKIVMTVTNIIRERSNGALPGQQLDLAVDLGFIANFQPTQYGEGLMALSLVISCLHQYPLLTPQIQSDLPADVEKVSLEMINHDPADLNHLFGMMGMKYQPAVFYRLRLLPYRAESLRARTPLVGEGVLHAPADLS